LKALASNWVHSTVSVGIIRRRAELGPPLPGQSGPFSLGGEGAFERESFGVLHQMLAGLDEDGRERAWQEVGEALGEFEDAAGFTEPCELLVGAATR
jgi:hypothetical protein